MKVLAEEGTYVDLEEEKEYSVVKLTNIFLAGLEYSNIGECFTLLQVTPNYIASGGDGYKFESWKTRDRILGSLDTEVLFNVLWAHLGRPLSLCASTKITIAPSTGHVGHFYKFKQARRQLTGTLVFS